MKVQVFDTLNECFVIAKVDRHNKEFIKIIVEHSKDEIEFIVIKVDNICHYRMRRNFVTIDNQIIKFLSGEDARTFFLKVFANTCKEEQKKIRDKQNIELQKEKEEFNSMKEDFLLFYKNYYKVDYYFDKKDIKALKEIQKKLNFLSQGKESVLDLFKIYIFSSNNIFLKDKFLKDKFNLTYLNSKYNDLIKNITDEQRTQQQVSDLKDSI